MEYDLYGGQKKSGKCYVRKRPINENADNIRSRTKQLLMDTRMWI
jgi:hypothetical protein